MTRTGNHGTGPDVTVDPAECTLASKTVGPLPIINHVMERLGLHSLLLQFVPSDIRSALPSAVPLGALLRNILVSREALYSVPDWSRRYAEPLLGIPQGAFGILNDDRIGRALDRLFEADRAALMTAVVVEATRKFGLTLDEFHNDTTTVTFEGQYRGATGHLRNGKATQRITFGHNKDHRPDPKQLVYNLTTTADGTTPVWCSVTHGNTSDDTTHIGTWEILRHLTGRSDFLYVADSKLCTRENMRHIDFHKGRFVTVLPRTRGEVSWFADWMQKHPPAWVELHRQPNSRLRDGPDEVYRGFESPLPTGEGYRILWLWSSQKAERDLLSRQRALARANEQLSALALRLQSPRSRITTAASAQEAAVAILAATDTKQLMSVAVEVVVDESFKQESPGRPGKGTRYVRVTREKLALHWSTQEEVLKAQSMMDGIFPLVTNDRRLPAREVLMAYKHQPALERRHEQFKSVLDVMPVFLKSPSRIEALLYVYFLALLVQALLERQVRRAMATRSIEDLPLYPEERQCRRPTAHRIFHIFDELRCHRLLNSSKAVVRTFYDPLTPQQSAVLQLLDLPESRFYAGVQSSS